MTHSKSGSKRLDPTLEYLYGLAGSGIKPGLGRIKALLNALGDPHKGYPTAVISGTNGKGSTSAAIAFILTEAGLTTGLYTSPHLVRFNERIRINGELVADDAVIELVAKVRSAAETLPPKYSPTFFEFTTAMAFEYFRTSHVDFAVLEVGMGGRLDATNVTTPEVAVITSISVDHAEFLGEDPEDITAEKAGIIRKGSSVVSGVRQPGLAGLIESIALSKGAGRVMSLGRDFDLTGGGSASGLEFATRDGVVVDGITPALRGAHQVRNIACALAAVVQLRSRGFKIPDRAVRDGISKLRWPGRFDVISSSPTVVLDCAHNPDGAAVLKDALAGLDYSELILVIGMMRDKDIDAFLAELAPAASQIIFTAPLNERAADPALLKDRAVKYGITSETVVPVREACARAMELARPEDAVCITGSIFTVGEAMAESAFYLKERCGRKTIP